MIKERKRRTRCKASLFIFPQQKVSVSSQSSAVLVDPTVSNESNNVNTSVQTKVIIIFSAKI